MLFAKFRFFRHTKEIRLTPEEKAASNTALFAYMKEHPVREGQVIRPLWQRSTFLHPVPVALLILLLLGGGTAYAAEGSLPDEALYPIKIHVNEAIREKLALSPTAKAKWDARVTERRLEEAEKLVSTGKLTANTKTRVLRGIEHQTQRAKQRIEFLKHAGSTSTAEEVNVHLEATLRSHAHLFESVTEKRREEQEKRLEERQPQPERFRTNTSSTRDVERIPALTQKTSTPSPTLRERDTEQDAAWHIDEASSDREHIRRTHSKK